MSTVPALPADAALRTLSMVSGLAFVAGFVDVVGFVALAGLFTAHVTGNFVLIGSEIVTASSGVLAKLLALPVFVAFVALTRIAIRRIEAKSGSPFVPTLLVQSALLVIFMITGVMLGPVSNPDALGPVLVGMAGVAAMAVQNASGRLLLGNQSPTTIMTGNTTQIVIDAVDMMTTTGEERSQAVTRLKRMSAPLLAFALGALLGALLYARFGFLAIALPILVLLAIVAAYRTKE